MSIPQQQAAPAAPAAPQSNDEAIGAFARDFLNDLETNDDPDQNTHTAPSEEPQPQDDPQDAEGLEAETPSPEPEVPLVEIELDGEKYQVPEKLKSRVMADKDYRQKTMEVAATRKQLEQHMATVAQLAQQAQQMAPYHAQLFQMENRIQQLGQHLNSPQLQNDPLEYNRVQGELGILLNQRDRFAQGLQQQVSQLTEQQQRLRMEKLTIDAPALFQEFPELAKPDNRQKLTKYVMDEGLPQEAIDYLSYSVTGTKLAWKAHQYDVMVKEQAANAAKLKERVKTLPAVAQSSRAADASAKDKQLQRDWQKRGGKISDPAFDQLLRSKLRSK